MAFIKSNRLVKSVLLGVIVIAFLEIFVFNFRHWATAGYTAADAQSYVTGHGYSVTVSDDGSFILNDSNDTWITFENMNMSLNTIFLDVPDGEDSTLTVGVYANDEANLAGFDLQTTTVCSTVKLTKYLRTHLSGQSDYMKIYFQNVTPGTTIRGIQFNRTIPFQISFLRIVLMVVIWVFFVLFGAKSSLYKVLVTEWKTNKKQAAAIAGAILFQCVLLYLIGYIVRPGQNMQAEIDNGVYVHGIYNELADALMEGHAYLDRQPTDTVISLENPYDPVLRNAALSAAGEQECMDYAYYEGKYYCYFGVLPAILFYIPYKLITGHDLMTWNLMPVLTVLTVLAIYWFVYVFCEKYFEKVSMAVYFLSGLFVTFASSIVYLVYYGTIYSVPIICSLLFSILGLTFWIDAKGSHTVCRYKLVIGSLFIAFTLQCRPAFILIFVLAIPIFWDELVKDRLFFSKKGLLNTVLVIVPFLIIGFATMYYNAIRFGSPFDFGATYNLTSNDMTRRGFVLERIPLGIFEYVFQPITVSGAFPFMEAVSLADDYIGQYNREPFFGGLLAYNALMILIPLNIAMGKRLKDIKYTMLSMAMVALGFIIMVVDIQGAGVVHRYMSDFSWLFAISTAMFLLSMETVSEQTHLLVSLWYKRVLCWGVLCCVVLNIWNIFINTRWFTMFITNPHFYYTVKTMLPFY